MHQFVSVSMSIFVPSLFLLFNCKSFFQSNTHGKNQQQKQHSNIICYSDVKAKRKIYTQIVNVNTKNYKENKLNLMKDEES